MDISKNILKVRTTKQMKQAEIAERLCIEPQNYSRLEKRGDKLTIEQLKKIAEALGVNYLELLGEGLGNNNEDKIKRLEEKNEKLQIKLDKTEYAEMNANVQLGGYMVASYDYSIELFRSVLPSEMFDKMLIGDDVEFNKMFSMFSDDELKDVFENHIVPQLTSPILRQFIQNERLGKKLKRLLDKRLNTILNKKDAFDANS